MIPRVLPVAALILAALAVVGAPPASAPAGAQARGDAGLGFDAYLELLKARARGEGVSDITIERMTEGLTPNPRVIALDQNQPGSGTTRGYPPMSNYIATHVDTARIGGGRAVYAQHRELLARIERDYGVPGPIIVAIFGHETSYGKVKGDFDLARSLATLAWEGRRRELFASEFLALMKIADKGYPRPQLVGSYAGAFGNPQFLPSVYLRLAADGDGDARADIFTNRADTFASIANYFRDAGWRPGQPWGVRASVPQGFDLSSFRTRLASPVCPRA
jgi:membrane-bound lytic murein transglycosylase B